MTATADLQPETKSPSRRALLTGAVGGIGAWAAAAIGRASPVRAADGNTVHVGDELTGISVTRITNDTNVSTVIWGDNHAGVGVVGSSDTSYGVLGTSDTSFGVSGESSNSNGVRGLSTFGTGVRGTSTYGRGVFGTSTNTAGVRGEGVIGVEGQSSNQYAYGVGGYNSAAGGQGVYGEANGIGSRGVNAYSDLGHALHASTNVGWAAYLQGRVFTSGYHELSETKTPAAPGTNRGRLFLRDNGAGKTELCVRFSTGAVQVLATQP